MNHEPKTIEEYKAAYDALRAENAELAEKDEAAKRIISRYKRKYGPLEEEPRPGITRVRFDR